MAITVETQPAGQLNTGAVGAGLALFSRSKLVSTFSSTSTSQTNFKYLIQVEEDGTEIFKSYVTPNPSGRCMFDVSPIVKERLKSPITQDNVNSYSIQRGGSPFGTTTTGNQNIYTIKIGEVYEVSGTLTEFPNLDSIQYLIVNGSQDYKDFYSDLGNVQLDLVDYSCNYLAPLEIKKGFLSNITPDTYKQTKDNEYFRNLAGSSIAVPTRETNLGRLAWIHDDVFINQDCPDINYTWYDSSGTQLATVTTDMEDPVNGGQALNSTDPEGKVLAVPCHWGSMLQASSSLVSVYTSSLAWTYYTIQLVRSDSNGANFKWAFYKDCAGNKNELYQLAWTNGVGFWDYFTFMPQTMHEESASKKQYNTNVGSYGADEFKIFKYDAGTKNYQVIPKRSWTLSSGKIDEELSKYLKEIIKARQVQLITPEGDVLPVIVDTESTNFYRDRTNKLYDFQVKVTLAQSLEG